MGHFRSRRLSGRCDRPSPFCQPDGGLGPASTKISRPDRTGWAAASRVENRADGLGGDGLRDRQRGAVCGSLGWRIGLTRALNRVTSGRDGLCPVPFFSLCQIKKEKESDGTEAVPPFPADPVRSSKFRFLLTPNDVSSAIHSARGLVALQGLDQHWSTPALVGCGPSQPQE
jgi:hypothetical protein